MVSTGKETFKLKLEDERRNQCHKEPGKRILERGSHLLEGPELEKQIG